MADGVPVTSVSNQKHMEIAAKAHDPSSHEPRDAQTEFYSGWVRGPWSGGPTVAREQIATFLPLSDSTTIRRYERVTVLEDDIVCTVSPTAFQFHEDEEGLASVDSAFVVLRDQSFSGIGGSPTCLILVVNIAILNGTLHSINYNVGLQYLATNPISDTIDLDNGEAPDV